MHGLVATMLAGVTLNRRRLGTRPLMWTRGVWLLARQERGQTGPDAGVLPELCLSRWRRGAWLRRRVRDVQRQGGHCPTAGAYQYGKRAVCAHEDERHNVARSGRYFWFWFIIGKQS